MDPEEILPNECSVELYAALAMGRNKNCNNIVDKCTKRCRNKIDCHHQPYKTLVPPPIQVLSTSVSATASVAVVVRNLEFIQPKIFCTACSKLCEIRICVIQKNFLVKWIKINAFLST